MDRVLRKRKSGKLIAFQMFKDQEEGFKELCERNEISASEVIRNLVDELLKREGLLNEGKKGKGISHDQAERAVSNL